MVLSFQPQGDFSSIISKKTFPDNLSSDDLKYHLGKDKVIPDDRWMLNRPDLMFFEGKPGFKEKFKELEHNFTPILCIWPVLKAAGVRDISEHVKINFLNCEGRQEAPRLRQRIEERRDDFERIYETFKNEDYHKSLKFLDTLICYFATNLEIQYLIQLERTYRSDDETVPAIYDREENALFVKREEYSRPWLQIATELAKQISTDQISTDQSKALAIKTILEIEDKREVEKTLDTIGCSRILPPRNGNESGSPIEIPQAPIYVKKPKEILENIYDWWKKEENRCNINFRVLKMSKKAYGS